MARNESQTFDFSGLVPVDKANPALQAAFRLKRAQRTDGPYFTFSEGLFTEIGAYENSLQQFNHPDGVMIGVVKGNDGIFAKKSDRGQKGKTYKNVMLGKALDDQGLTTNFLDLEFVGEHEGTNYYRVVIDAKHPANQQSNKEPASEPEEAKAEAESMAETDEF